MKGSVFLKKLLIITAILIIISTMIKTNAENKIVIPEESLRFRIIANSNNIEDHKVKNQVKNALEKELTTILATAENIDESKEIMNNKLDDIRVVLDKILVPKNINYDLNYGSNYFPAKTFKGVIYNEGNYDSLVITLGEGRGDNWWCVLFPPLCLLEDNTNTSDIEYQFYISRIINKFK